MVVDSGIHNLNQTEVRMAKSRSIWGEDIKMKTTETFRIETVKESRKIKRTKNYTGTVANSGFEKSKSALQGKG